MWLEGVGGGLVRGVGLDLCRGWVEDEEVVVAVVEGELTVGGIGREEDEGGGSE